MDHAKSCESWKLRYEHIPTGYSAVRLRSDRQDGPYRSYPIVTVQHYLERALEANAIQLNLKIEEITTDIRMIVIGNVFEWAMRNGDADFEGNMRRSLSHYLDSIFVV